MDLIERLRPRWRHPVPEVRAAAVREMGEDDRQRLAAIAGDDPDARVRRVAIKKLDDTGVLERLAANDPDPALRLLAGERLGEVLVAVAASGGPLADCAAALARLGDERLLAAVAIGGSHEPIRRAALARVAGDRVLRDVVRRASDPVIRREALARIADPAVLRGIAVGEGTLEIGLLALDRIDDVAALRAIAVNRSAPRGVRQQAQARIVAACGEEPSIGVKEGRARQLALCTMVHGLRVEADVLAGAERVHEARREWQELAATVEPRDDVAQRFAAACATILDAAASLARRQEAAEGARTAAEENLATRVMLCERVEALDGADAPRALADARAAWARLAPIPDQQDARLAERFAAAGEACEARHERWLAGESVRTALATLLHEAEALAAASPPATPEAWNALERRWDALDAAALPRHEMGALRERLARAGERLRERREEAARHRDTVQRQHVARLEALCAQVDELVTSAALKPRAAHRQLDAVDAALRDPGPLAAAARRAWAARLDEARSRLLRRMGELEETEQWRRWANTAVQEEIIARVEALLDSNDLAEGTRQLARLQDEWDAVATATPDKSRALWERFRAVRNDLRKRCDAYLAENLERKRALCARVADLGDSTAWNETAELIKSLQAEWKAIGPVPTPHASGIWQQFREPCDRFFGRRKEHFERLDGERRAHAQKKAALCEQAEGLADSTDWDATAAAIKRLQTEWKQSGTPRRAEAEALWQRFRAACDRFFDRYRRRDELARDEVRAGAVAICDRLEALATSIEAGELAAADAGSVGPQIEETWSEWLRIDSAALGDARALEERLATACERIAAAAPGCLQGTRLDPDATRAAREKLCQRLDDLLGGLRRPAREMSVREMALALRERLASNTIAGSAGTGASRHDTARELERITAAWGRLGPALGGAARALADRFEHARAEVRALLQPATSRRTGPAENAGRQ